MHNDHPLRQTRLKVETGLDALEDVLQWFEEFTSPLLPQKFCGECKLAFIEGFTNAARHAHQGLPKTTPIDLELVVFAHCFEMRIWDWGGPFDLQPTFQALRQQGRNPLEDEGGRGLILMHQLTDEVSYLRQPDQRNCLLLRKQL